MRYRVISRKKLSMLYSDGIAHGAVKIGREWCCVIDVADEHADRLEDRLNDDDNVITYRRVQLVGCGVLT